MISGMCQLYKKSTILINKINPLPYKELIFPDVLKVLNEVKSQGLKIGLASSSVKADIFRALEENRLQGFFDIVLSGEEFKESKTQSRNLFDSVKAIKRASKSCSYH